MVRTLNVGYENCRENERSVIRMTVNNRALTSAMQTTLKLQVTPGTEMSLVSM